MKKLFILALAGLAVTACVKDPFHPTQFGTPDTQPNTALASTDPYIPTKSERKSFDDLFTLSAGKTDVLNFMGHPTEIWIGRDEKERWRYSWGDSCIVRFVGDTVDMALYSGSER